MSVVPQVSRTSAILMDCLVLYFTWKGTAFARKVQRDGIWRMNLATMIFRNGMS